MWWSSARPRPGIVRARRCRAATALIAAVLLVAGCGFSPLYGGGRDNAALDQLNRITIARIPDRAGQELRNSLIDRISSRPSGAPALYRLAITLSVSRSALAIQFDDSVTRFNLTMMADFQLVEIATGAVVYHDTARTVGSYNVVRSDFATLVSEQDAEKRAAREIGDEITTLLSVYFARRAGGSA